MGTHKKLNILFTKKFKHWYLCDCLGSSAGAGSGDFHVYRSVRRREYARQKFINEMAEQVHLSVMLVLVVYFWVKISK